MKSAMIECESGKSGNVTWEVKTPGFWPRLGYLCKLHLTITVWRSLATKCCTVYHSGVLSFKFYDFHECAAVSSHIPHLTICLSWFTIILLEPINQRSHVKLCPELISVDTYIFKCILTVILIKQKKYHIYMCLQED